jgi:hypothetical protein
MKPMHEYEQELAALPPLELLHRFEELTIALHENRAQLGDYHRQMLCKRVMLRKMAPNALDEAALHWFLDPPSVQLKRFLALQKSLTQE